MGSNHHTISPLLDTTCLTLLSEPGKNDRPRIFLGGVEQRPLITARNLSELAAQDRPASPVSPFAFLVSLASATQEPP